jgi:hypothetical protein
VRFVVVRKGCHLNPIWRTFSLGGPSEFIELVFNPWKSIILVLEVSYPSCPALFQSVCKIHMKPSLFHCISVSQEKEWRPKQVAKMPIYFQMWQWRTVKLMTLLHCAYITSFGIFKKSGLFFLWVWLLVLRSFLFSGVYVFNRVFWGGASECHSMGSHWTKTLCTTYTKWGTWWAWAFKMAFCALCIWRFRLYFLLGYSVFQHCDKRTKWTLKIFFLLKNAFFQVKSLSKRLSWWVIIHVEHCVTLLHLKIQTLSHS